MAALLKNYMTSASIAVMSMVAQQKVREPFPYNKVYNRLDMCLTVTLTRSEAYETDDPSEPAQEGVLALIRSMEFEINGTSGHYTTSGRHLLAQMIHDEAVTPTGYAPIDITQMSQTIQICFPYRFDLPLMQEQLAGFLHLANTQNDPTRIQSVNLLVDWGSINDIFNDAGCMSVTAASLVVEGTSLQSDIVPHVGSVYKREYRTVEETYSRSHVSGNVKILEIPREQGLVLKNLIFVQTRNGVPVPFGDGTMVIKHGTTTLDSLPLWKVRDRQNKPRLVDVPSNMLFHDFAERSFMNDGITDAQIAGTDKIQVTLPAFVNSGDVGDTAVYKIEMMVEYVTGLAR